MTAPDLLLSPKWDRADTWLPALAAFVAHAPRSGPRLLIDAREAALPVDLLGELCGHACDWAAQGEDFAEVELVWQPGDAVPERAVPVSSAADVAALLHAAAPTVPRDPVERIAWARDVKHLIDALDRRVAAHRYLAAPDPWDDPEPLVSVRIPTWGGTDLLLKRAIPSALSGSYPNIEVVVVSDGPDPSARAAVASVSDPRVRYVEVPQRPRYATSPQSFWQTAGTSAVNLALDHCRGAFIAPLDHDDAFTDTHVSDLLSALREAGADFVYGQAACELRHGGWTIIGATPLACGRITHGSVLYSRRLAHMRYDPLAWLLDEPGDWNMWRRMAEMGAAICHLPKVVQIHFREKTAIEDDPRASSDILNGPVPASAEDLAADLDHVGAAWLAEVPRRDRLPAAVA
ncbi:MAG: glycosyltransferase family 2 protein [Actinomycetota bacterium]